MRESTDTTNISGKTSTTRRKYNTASRRAALESDMGTSGKFDREKTERMDQCSDRETTENISCDGREETKEGHGKTVAKPKKLDVKYTRVLSENQRNRVAVRWIRNGVMIIDEMVYIRSAGDEDIVDRLQAKRMVSRGDVRIEK